MLELMCFVSVSPHPPQADPSGQSKAAVIGVNRVNASCPLTGAAWPYAGLLEVGREGEPHSRKPPTKAQLCEHGGVTAAANNRIDELYLPFGWVEHFFI
ncbi:MAG: hypothetical protein DWQ07_25835 [Chloroflexi bacterium]|nr:MAG: hypothetical protein DWQ07_25835 [Chloroflexota bacterium]